MRILQLGRDAHVYGELKVWSTLNGACAISVGGDPESPSMRFKRTKNEDGLLWDDAPTRTLVVADAHFGDRASKVFLQALDEAMPTAPLDFVGLETDFAEEDASGSALTLLRFDPTTGKGWGLNYGDCTAAVLSAAGYRKLNTPDTVYLRAGEPPPAPASFDFEVAPGGLLVAFTDGVDECHYRQPETSIRPHHIEAIYARVGADPRAFAAALGQLALSGVEGNPGGQDNIAIVVAQT